MFLVKKTPMGLGAAIALGLSLLNVNQAQALPLLAENAGIMVDDIITAYPDDKDPNLVYFMPNSSVMARDAENLPQFGLTYWGLSNGGPIDQAGGYMTFTARLYPDASQKRALDGLRAQGKRVAVIPVQASTMGITSTKPGSTPLSNLFSEFNFAAKAGVMEQEVGVNAALTGIGAKVFKAAIDTPQLIKADYCYKVTGLGPNFDATITANMSRVYDYFSASYSSGWLSKKTISVEVEKLRQANAIKIVINGGDAKMEEYVQKIAETIVQRIFTPELKTGPGPAGGDGGWSFSRYSLNLTHKEENKEETWQYIRRDLVDREFCANVALKDLKPYKDQLVRDADK